MALLLSAAPVAKAKTYEGRDCDGAHHKMDTRDPGNYTDGTPVDFCARGFFGFSKMVFIGQLWAGSIAAVFLLVTGFIFFTAHGNANRRLAAGSAMGFLVLGMALILSAQKFIDLLYSIFGGA